ncbi:murein DD-endopeptidase MepM/ murein hydrolase activator NlpD [Keratinibaculum paraultunense]|uniref:Murein DD-endopeptidase MepM/ murein hydrolase activator NlpD n=1 Tax=Keratinibaculum paraultunense TaxID=1278232 RepID=A0A4R3KT02_9FIRM|nr:M23 family metallopeptidase [Keratinibaculum paraultunense]QQY79598.1 peptidoglycan DD-metalloendopeptidase family protein [Keratinibaculum paraultunense]TCS87621.1 murein DD-endopeptidase MepM/ murein hydrolase activator NlpD [Keratinibaculum paraultunense]
MKNKDNSKICIMIIPHTEKVKRITIPKWVPKVIITAIAIVVTVTLVFFNNMSSSEIELKEEYNNKITELSNLEKEYENKQKELEKLKSQNLELYEITNEVKNKLVEIDKLQRQLEKMAGIKSSSRGNIIRKINPEKLDPEKEMEVSKELLEDKEKELEIFIQDLEERFEYLESIPDLWPAEGELTSTFGNRKNPFGKGTQFHQGIDINNSSGTDVKAAAKGIVVFSGDKAGYGKVIIIDHGNDYSTLYGHNKKLLVNVGDKVEKGQVIAKMGNTGRSTGPHLHFEIHKSGNPINPLEVLK